MKRSAVVSFILTVAMVYANGPVAAEEELEECNPMADETLALLSRALNASENYVVTAGGVCKICKVWNLGSIVRTGDMYDNEISEGTYERSIKIGFTSIRLSCDCSTVTSSSKNISGNVDLIWTGPRLTLKKKASEGSAPIRTITLDTPYEKTLDAECVGSPDWKENCINLKAQRQFDIVMDRVIKNIFRNAPRPQMYQFYTGIED